jgi:hypothetical protein
MPYKGTEHLLPVVLYQRLNGFASAQRRTITMGYL